MSQDLATFLQDANLSDYQPKLQQLGVAAPGDIADAEDADLEAMGMKVLEVKRIRRKLEELNAGSAMVVSDYDTEIVVPDYCPEGIPLQASVPPVVQAYEQPQPQQMAMPTQPQGMVPSMMQPGMVQPGMLQQGMLQDGRPPPPDNCVLNWICCASAASPIATRLLMREF